MPKTRRGAKRRRGITRIDQPSTRTHGFFARLGWHRRRDGSYGPRHTAFFGDVTHGGKRGALKAAEKWVAGIEKKEGRKGGRKASARRGRSKRRA
jgi:hypothetical protein